MNYWKKTLESEDLRYFLDAYGGITGQDLSLHGSERPDFVGVRSNGDPVGLEITSVVRDPDRVLRDRILSNVYHMDGWDAVDMTWALAARKAEKLRDADWQHPDHTILVVVFRDALLRDAVSCLDQSLQHEWASLGFEELWILDLSQLDVYGDAELFGIHPSEWWGLYPREFQKPYG